MRKASVISLTLFLAAASLALLSFMSTPAAEVRVSPGTDAQALLDAAPAGASVVFEAGRHRGPLVMSVAMDVRGEPGAEIVAPVTADAAIAVTADDVSISDVVVRGGWTGIDLLKADNAALSDVVVTGAELQGVRVYGRAAVLDSIEVSGLLDPHAQGIEVLSAPDVVVQNSSVRGGKIGIVAHLSDEVEFRGNHVTGTSLAAVVIREMSRGSASSNVIEDAEGAGLYCGDMSTCSFEDNRVAGIRAADSTRSGAGWGLVVHYKSTASTTGDTLGGVAGEALLLDDSIIAPGPATRRGRGIGASLPAAVHSGAFVLVLAIGIVLIPRRWIKRWVQPTKAATDGRQLSEAVMRAVVPVVLVFLAVQTFHMLEHVIQLVRVHGRGVPGRGGLAGQVVDNEWAHFLYNSVVLAGMYGLLWVRKKGWRPQASEAPDRLLFAAAALQTYHVIEHSTKLVQHISGGVKVGPGILGEWVDLVYLHFGINAAVYLAFVGATGMYLAQGRGRGSSERWRGPVRAGIASGLWARR